MKRLLLTTLFAIIFPSVSFGEVDNIILSGRVTALSGEPVADAEIYIYATNNTRRPADFISPRTGSNGIYRLVIPKASYWAVARIKRGERFGPLRPGDRHSGEPIKIEFDTDSSVAQDFVVADMQELAQSRTKGRADLVEITGVITSADKPLSGAYVFARSDRISVTIPGFFSSWSDSRGEYKLRLPPGQYYLGVGTEFPLPDKPVLLKEVNLVRGKLPVAINLQLPLE